MAWLVAAVCLVVSIACLRADAQQVGGEEVRRAVQAGIRYIRNHQAQGGGWPEVASYRGASTAISLLALLTAGVPATDPDMKAGLEYLARTPNERTYVVAIKAMVFALADPQKYQAQLRSAAQWLIAGQFPDGMWNYGNHGSGDNSNSQYALLGLHEAARAGISVPEAVWRRARFYWLETQCQDGGWRYTAAGPTGYGSMTAAGVASLFICGNSLYTSAERGFINGIAPGCGNYREDPALKRGFNWLAQNFTVETNPRRGSWHYYYLYALERVGILTGRKYIGNYDWYRRGAAFLVANQRADGSWSEQIPLVDTAFALMFLAKGHRPLLINKLKWSADNEWNLDRSDIEHLVSFIDDKLGERLSWQTVDSDAPLEDWLAAPILYFSGHKFPQFDDRAVRRLRDYVEQGGTILAEACCGRKTFVEGFRRFAAQAFPDWPLRPLEPDHPVFNALFSSDRTFPLEGVDLGCRTSIIFSPSDLSCLWEQGTIPQLSKKAFELGANIAAYATGRRPLRDKLEVVRLTRQPDLPTSQAVRGALQIAQLIHNGDWRPDPLAIPHLAEFLSQNVGIDVANQARFIDPADAALRDYPVAYMTGHFTFRFTDAQIAGLRTWLRNGGFLLAEACCGRQAFDAAFREMIALLLPDCPLQRLDRNHPILAGHLGFNVDRVTYRPAVRNENPSLTVPELYGAAIDGRTAVVYCPFGLECGWEGHSCFTCRGLEPDDAKKLAANIFLYAISY